MANLLAGTRTARTTFLVGRLTRGSAQIVVVEGSQPPPIPGPWTLRALVRPARFPGPRGEPGSTIH